jgi:hypothetical protein
MRVPLMRALPRQLPNDGFDPQRGRACDGNQPERACPIIQATTCARDVRFSLPRMLATCRSAVETRDHQLFGYFAIAAPARYQARYFKLPSCKAGATVNRHLLWRALRLSSS